MKYGYVWSRNQELEQQLNDLREFGCGTIFVDNDHHEKNEIPPALIRIVHRLQKGDVIVVWTLDLWDLSLKALIEYVSTFREKGVEFVSLKDDIDTETEIGRFTFKILASMKDY